MINDTLYFIGCLPSGLFLWNTSRKTHNVFDKNRLWKSYPMDPYNFVMCFRIYKNPPRYMKRSILSVCWHFLQFTAFTQDVLRCPFLLLMRKHKWIYKSMGTFTSFTLTRSEKASNYKKPPEMSFCLWLLA